MPDRGKVGFNWITGADALPMLSWEVEECHELGPIFLQAQRRLGVFGFIDFDEQIECLLCMVLGLSLPDVVDRGFGLWLRQLGQAVEHVHRFVLPTPLLAGRGIDLIHGSPKPHGSILDCQKAFLATGRYPNNDKGAELVILAPKAAVDAVR